MTPGGTSAGKRPCYLLPLRWHPGTGDLAGLTRYLRRVARVCDVVVVDGSPTAAFLAHAHAWRDLARHISPDPALACRNGKVAGVLTGMRATGADRVIIADDDVRYDTGSLAKVLARLENADLVVPQNYFRPLPWHAAWDSARILVNRAFGSDYPGTLAVRRGAFLRAGCYDGDVLFENLELIRTMRAAGARVAYAPDVFVRRLPPGARHFAGQRVREAYDSQAQPLRLAAELALLPMAVVAATSRRYAALGWAAAAAAGVAEVGRRRHGGTEVFPWPVPLLAPAWLAERSLCSWLAVACKLRGGIRYAGQPIARAGTSMAALRRQAGHARRNRQVSPGRDLALITPYENGPLIVRGSFMITAQDGTPIPAGRKTVALCRCGQSALKPFCDGSHTRTGFRACGGEDVLRRPRASAGDD